jgi:hypothetical protein
MRAKWFSLLAVGLLSLTSAGPVAAQFPARPGGIVPNNPPPFSPSLNLLRTDIPTYLNYYGTVRPENEFRGGIQNLQRQQAQTEDEVAGANSAANLAATGHGTSFLNTGGYFLNRSGAPGARGQGQGQGTAGRSGQGQQQGAYPRP